MGERQRQGDEWRGHRLAEDGYIDPFSTNIVIPYSGPYVFPSLTEGSQPGSAGSAWNGPPTTSGALRSLCPELIVASTGWRDWPSDSVTDRDSVTLTESNRVTWLTVCTCVYIISHSYAVRLWFTWSALAYQPTRAVFLFTLLEHAVAEIPDWQLNQMSICNKGSSQELQEKFRENIGLHKRFRLLVLSP